MNLVNTLMDASPLLQLLAGLVALAATILVGRFVLQIAWKLVIVATVIVAAVYALSVAGLL